MKGFIRKSQPINVFFSNVNVALQLIRILLVSTLGRKKKNQVTLFSIPILRAWKDGWCRE